MPMMMKLGYFGEAERRLVRFAEEETTPAPKDDEVVVFKSFFRVGLRLPLNEMLGEVLKNFKIYLHQLIPNAIVRLSVFILSLQSQGCNALNLGVEFFLLFSHQIRALLSFLFSVSLLPPNFKPV
jgi:hypothetical protein